MYLQKNADAVRLLAYQGGTNTPPSFDVLILRQTEPLILRGERKKWRDFVSTWLEGGRLERQLCAVDFLIIELPNSEDRKNWDEVDERAMKHLTRVSFNMPVIVSQSDQQTMALYRYLETTQNLNLRDNRTVAKTEDFYADLIKILGLNPGRLLRSGKTVRDEIMCLVDKWALAGALGLGKWHKIGGLGRKALSQAAAKVLSPK